MEYITQNQKFLRGFPIEDPIIIELCTQNKITYFDYKFAKFMTNFFEIKDNCKDYFTLFLILIKEIRLGHVCLNKDEILNHELAHFFKNSNQLNYILNNSHLIYNLNSNKFNIESLCDKPLVILNDKVYLTKYWKFENEVLKYISHLVNTKLELDISVDLIKKCIEKIFPSHNLDDDIDWQKFATLLSIIKNFLIITGGPGTGKTRTIAAVIVLNTLIANHYSKDLKILLCAPTGKAAKKLSESISTELSRFKCLFHDDNNLINLINLIPTEVSTIHRLLGYNPIHETYKYNENNKLDVDLLIVDETSMIDLELLVNLINALPCKSKLILVGDKNQLSSVETGSIFSDLCDIIETQTYSNISINFLNNFFNKNLNFLNFMKSQNKLSNLAEKLQDSTVVLKKNYRFSNTSGIYHLSNAINNGDIKTVLNIIHSKNFNDLYYETLNLDNIFQTLKNTIINLYYKLKNTQDPLTALNIINQVKVLSPIKEGQFGVHHLNNIIESILISEKLIENNSFWYHGKPIIITENDYLLRLFNGDIGIILTDTNQKTNLAYFITNQNEIASFSPLKLPSHDTVYAMTIHKSQGSDFDHVIIILPDITEDKNVSKIYTRELLYTAVTRAKKSVKIFANIDTIIKMISQKTNKISGFYERILKEQIY